MALRFTGVNHCHRLHCGVLVFKTRYLGGVKLSVMSEFDTIADVNVSGRAMIYSKIGLQLVVALAVLGFCWSFVLPLIGLLLVTSRFFAG